MKWEIKKVRSGEEEELLKAGWEPFATIVHHGSYRFLNTTENKMETQLTNTDYIYLRRKLK